MFLSVLGVLLSWLIVPQTPFSLRIVDDETGAGIPHTRVVSDSGIVCYTTVTGGTLWGESSVMNRHVTFTLSDNGAQYEPMNATVAVSRGKQITLRVHRRS